MCTTSNRNPLRPSPAHTVITGTHPALKCATKVVYLQVGWVGRHDVFPSRSHHVGRPKLEPNAMLSPYSKPGARVISRVRTQVRPKTLPQPSTRFPPSAASHKPFHNPFSSQSSTLTKKPEANQVSPKPTTNMPSYIVSRAVPNRYL